MIGASEHITGKTVDEQCKELQALYLQYIELDGKPEKGERKLADDLVLLIDEKLGRSNDQRIETIIYRIGLLEYALLLSPYNFDIQMSLVKIYDAQGLTVNFNTAYQNLGLKGVQMESMGFI